MRESLKYIITILLVVWHVMHSNGIEIANHMQLYNDPNHSNYKHIRVFFNFSSKFDKYYTNKNAPAHGSMSNKHSVDQDIRTVLCVIWNLFFFILYD